MITLKEHTITLKEYTKEVRRTIKKERNRLLLQAKIIEKRFPGISVKKVCLSGSFSTKSKKKPTEESDIDIAVYFCGGENISTLEIAYFLFPLDGKLGLYDVHPIRIK